MFYRVFITLITIIFVSCNGCVDSGKNPIEESLNTKDSQTPVVGTEEMGDVIDNIGSPVEWANMIKQNGVQFSKKYLAPTDNIDDLNTQFRQALALGILGADLGYLNMYSRTSSILQYISSIKELSDELKIGQFFDFETLKRLSTNNENLDSLTYISVSSFNKMDKYLRERNRGNVSALIVSGLWLEGIYLATQVTKEIPNAKISERIGEQKIVLGLLVLILNNYSKDPVFKEFSDYFNKIYEELKKVDITYKVGEPKSIVKNGIMTIEQTEESIVKITPEQLKSITIIVEQTRNKLVNAK